MSANLPVPNTTNDAPAPERPDRFLSAGPGTVVSPADADGGVTSPRKENDERAPGRGCNKRQRERIPFHERIGCSVADAVEASGRSRSRLYEKMKSGELAFWKDGKHRIVSVQSLLALKD
jgi:hypothetical protein